MNINTPALFFIHDNTIWKAVITFGWNIIMNTFIKPHKILPTRPFDKVLRVKIRFLSYCFRYFSKTTG